MSLVLEPIGYLRSGPSQKFLAPSQPDGPVRGQLELLPQYQSALADLDGFSRIWLIWWFHKNEGWRPRVLPPRSRTGRKGLFATRAPYRPCPLGLSTVPLLGVEGCTLWLGEHDLVDGTPVLDVKPYIPEVDSFPEARSGWFGQLENARRYRMVCSDLARAQLAWLDENHDPTFSERVGDILETDPMPHRTRRIMRLENGALRMACGDYRVYFRVDAQQVEVEKVTVRDGARAPQHEAYRAFRPGTR